MDTSINSLCVSAVGCTHPKSILTLLLGALLSVTLPIQAAAVSDSLSLDTAIARAQHNDPWLAGSHHQQQMLISRSVAAASLPDPRISLSALNLPSDNFDFGQEPMTQFKVGVSQMFARGDSLALQNKKFQLLSQQHPFLRQDRRAQVAVNVAALWFDVYRAQESIRLIEKDRPLFEQLTDVAQARYATVSGGARQQDIVRAQLELTQLEDRLTVLHQHREVAQRSLSQWIGEQFVHEYTTAEANAAGQNSQHLTGAVTTHLPQLPLLQAELITKPLLSHQELASYFLNHPSVLALDNRIQASRTEVKLARQKYKPQWSVNASYGYRENDDFGQDRSDLVSVGVSFDIPLFTGNLQDKQVQAAVSQAESVTTEKWLLLRKMIANFEASRATLKHLNQRYQLYQQQLLPQMHEQAEVALTAYTNDEGDFAEVVRARIAVLNAKIDALGIAVDRQKATSHINYYFVNSSATPAQQARNGGEA